MHMNASIRPSVVLNLLVVLLASCAAPLQEKQEQLQAEAKFPQAEARKLALGKVPGGQVKSAELEREHGVLIWSFDITMPNNKNITEVAVDAKTGKIANVEIETPEQQAKEAKEDKKD
jgi:hypothetical protein